MNFLYARSKKRFKIVLSGGNCPDLYSSINISDLKLVPYSPNVILENDEWYEVIVDRNMMSDPLELLSRQVKTTLKTLVESEYEDILYLIYRPSNSDYFYLQRIRSKDAFFSKHKLTFSKQPKIISSPIIAIAEEPDAIYQISSNKLFFRNLGAMNSIFSGINGLYRAATDVEIIEFLALDNLLSVEDTFEVTKVSIPIRKHLAKALDDYKKLNQEVIIKLHAYLATLKLPKNSAGKYIIDSERALKDFIFAVQERFYTTEATNEERMAQAYQTR